MDNVREHLDDVIKVMEESHRISKPVAAIKIYGPYLRAHGAHIDPTHKPFFTTPSFSYFNPEHIQSRLFSYSCATYKIDKTEFNEKINLKGIPALVKILTKWRPSFY